MKVKTQVTCTTCGVSGIRNNHEEAETWARQREIEADELVISKRVDPMDLRRCVFEYATFEVRDETAPGNL